MTGLGLIVGPALFGAGIALVGAGLSLRPRWSLGQIRNGQPLYGSVKALSRAIANRLRGATFHREWEEGFERAAGRLAGLLASGHGLIQGLELVADGSDPFSRQLAGVTAMVRAGVPLRNAMERWPGRTDTSLLNRFRSLLTVHERTGAALARPLWTLVGQCHRRRDLRERARSRTVEARLTAGLLLGLPPLLAAYFMLVRRDLLAVLMESVAGRAVIGYAVASWGLGGWLIRHLIGRAVETPWSGEGRQTQ